MTTFLLGIAVVLLAAIALPRLWDVTDDFIDRLFEDLW